MRGATAHGSTRRRRPRPNAPGRSGLAEAVARYLFKLMAYKDEYEVARLYSDGAFLQAGGERARRRQSALPRASRAAAVRAHRQVDRRAEEDDASGRGCSRCSALLAKFKFLRGTLLDPFGYSAERKTERAADRATTRRCSSEVLAKLTPENHHLSRSGSAAIPEKIRGFGHVKQRHLKAAKADEAALLEQFRAGPPPLLKAAE